jgi:3-methyladenine DNA glycosylase AlkD
VAKEDAVGERDGAATSVAEELTARLAALADPERAVQERRYLKSDLQHLGVSVPGIRRTVRDLLREREPLDHDAVVALVCVLWDQPVPAIHERRLAAVEVLERCRPCLGPDDVGVLERFLREARTWALVDGLAASVVGELALAEPAAFDPIVRCWATDPDHWLRRSSLLVHLPGIRQGGGDVERFLELADPMLGEQEFFVRKAIGWVLRELGGTRPEVVVAWLEPRLGQVAGLTLREAVKRLPEANRDRLLAAYRTR